MRYRVVVIVLASLSALSAVGQASIEAADAAFHAGRHDEALALYDEILAADPEHLRALIQSGKLLSWRNDHDEAIARYDRALAIDASEPTALLERAKVLSWAGRYDESVAAYRAILAASPNRPEARLGLARVLSWDGRFDEAAAAFRAILADDPDDLEARLGLARVFSWSGNQLSARGEYQGVLDRDPANTSAMLGIAQTYAWSGESVEARHWYDSVLEADPEQRGALLGTAYLDLWGGDRFHASRKASLLAQRFPNDDEITRLQQAIRRDSAPVVELNSYRIDDTDDNRVSRYGIESTFAFPRRADFTLAYDRVDVSNTLNGREGTVDSAYGSLLWRPRNDQRVVLRAGVDVLESTAGETENEPIGSLSYAIGVGGRLEGRLQAERRAFYFTTTSLDRGIVADEYSGRLVFRPRSNIRISGGAAFSDLSDENQRIGYDGGISYRLPLPSWNVDLSYHYRFFDYDLNLDNGYFDPQDFSSHSAGLNIERDLGSHLYASANVTTGLQSFTLGENEVSDDQYLATALLLGVRLTPALSLEVRGATGDYALQNASGYESDELTARLRWRSGW